MRITNAIHSLALSDLRRDRRVTRSGLYLPTRTLICEHRAESLLGADGTAISSWSAFGRPRENPTGVGGTGDWSLTQGTGINQPIVKTGILSGYPVARFDGSNDFLNYPNTGSGMGHFSYFCVVRVNDTANRTIFAGDGSSAQIQLVSNQVFLVKVGTSIPGNSTAALNTTNFFTIGVLYDRFITPATLDFYINGVLDTSVAAATDLSVGNIYMGGRSGGTTEPFAGDIAHDAFYYSKLSTIEVGQVHHVLRSLYNHY